MAGNTVGARFPLLALVAANAISLVGNAARLVEALCLQRTVFPLRLAVLASRSVRRI